MKKYSYLLFFVLTFLSLSCQEKDPKPVREGTIQLEFEHIVRSLGSFEALRLNSATYINDAGEPYTFTQFKYYISNLKLKRKDGTEFAVPESYYLIDQENPASRIVNLEKIPEGDYSEISFIIGVDSIRNVSGAQTGALDPAHGMFWSWNTGYIFLRMEGTSPKSTQPNQKLAFHIGGFQGSTNAIRKVTSTLASGNSLEVKAGKKISAHYHVFVSNMFGDPNRISFTKTSVVHGGSDVVKVADNYKGMFMLDHIHQDE